MGVDSKLRDIFMAAIPFVTVRRKPDGGFGATPRLPATIEDTFNALHILRLAKEFEAVDESGLDPSADKNLRAYLAVRRQTLPAGIRITFQLLWCCKAIGLEFDQDFFEKTVIARMKASDSLADWYYGTRILADVLGGKSRLVAEAPNLATVMDKKWRAIDEAWMQMYLSRQFRNTLPLPEAELVAWCRACQNGDGGFGFFPGTTSFVENCHAALRALAFLGEGPLDPGRAFLFLTGCQTVSGGFGRTNRAAPFLDVTWHALAAMAIIG